MAAHTAFHRTDDASGHIRGARTDEVYSEFDLRMRPGFAHDLDVAPGQATNLPIGLALGSAQSNRGDLYRREGREGREGPARRLARLG